MSLTKRKVLLCWTSRSPPRIWFTESLVGEGQLPFRTRLTANQPVGLDLPSIDSVTEGRTARVAQSRHSFSGSNFSSFLEYRSRCYTITIAVDF
ncbi:hypothetical protein CA85_12990 [Allorhodopirellula solitaria]|uniref:Uncharacterized protein n=1 Tax=Allorhodopirellula solitaria TaxID=2527987 RepID=A0A5C5YGB2_9BACT|nr:hypothetical protein CA85_12990 [Allorhodopirellula solitaria]